MNKRVALFFILFALPASALAGDGGAKTMPGAACFQLTSGQWDIRRNQDGAGNFELSQAVTVYCPIVRDDLNEDDLNAFSVWVDDEHDGDAVDCRLVTRDLDYEGTGANYYGSTDSSSIANTNLEELNPSIPAVTLGADASYIMYCLLPDADVSYSYVTGYRWDE